MNEPSYIDQIKISAEERSGRLDTLVCPISVDGEWSLDEDIRVIAVVDLERVCPGRDYGVDREWYFWLATHEDVIVADFDMGCAHEACVAVVRASECPTIVERLEEFGVEVEEHTPTESFQAHGDCDTLYYFVAAGGKWVVVKM